LTFGKLEVNKIMHQHLNVFYLTRPVSNALFENFKNSKPLPNVPKSGFLVCKILSGIPVYDHTCFSWLNSGRIYSARTADRLERKLCTWDQYYDFYNFPKL
jgi:hypothetical protein